ncbi:hypothetical protein I5M27_03400 [Adhaeribacter sp. BT258]|uniref:SnoaL-like domain-containing protein n=1 Tax=Adhaeribacter terrigena TaxID=2793070 RepID=A0ABS1BY38_9BACT|nr:hypothetical protein [Adhaeribacter terrigena]MBK0402015.1 hypothetical protein [Adhaeribacter terrigena]
MLERSEKTFYCALTRLLPLVLVASLAACNPFAPELDDAVTDPNKLLGDRKTVNGFFEWFRNSYQLRDSTLYGQIVAPDFRFTYFDFTNNTEVSWPRDVEMSTTYKLFRGVRATSLQWNQYILADTAISDTVAIAERAFNLTINQDDATIYRGVGSARIVLTRKNRNDNWKMRSWYDKSDF